MIIIKMMCIFSVHIKLRSNDDIYDILCGYLIAKLIDQLQHNQKERETSKHTKINEIKSNKNKIFKPNGFTRRGREA